MIIPKLRLLLGYLLISGTAIHVSADHLICQDAMNEIFAKDDVEDDFFALINRVELSRITSAQQEPLLVTTRYDYSSFSGNNFRVIRDNCQDDFGYDLCVTISKTKHFDTIDDINVVREISEIFKPVCFPKSCSDEQINIVDPTPAGCNPDGNFGGNCEIIDQSVICPVREVAADTSMCAADLVGPGTPYGRRSGVLFGLILRDCTAVLGGLSGTYCHMDFDQLKMDTFVNFTDFKDIEQYTDYENTCAQQGGRICEADVTTDYLMSLAGIGDLMITDKFLNFPFCLAPACSEETDVSAMTNIFRKYTTESIMTPDCPEGLCDVNIGLASCSTISPTPVPSVSPDPIQTEDFRDLNCSEAESLLADSDILTRDFYEFTNRMELNKTISSQEDSLLITARYDYSLFNGTTYQTAKNICENDFGYDLCSVSTKTKHFESVNDLPIVREITELSKPVCFPKSCSGEQINIVDPTPAGCNPDGNFGGNCEIIEQSVICPVREVAADTSMCPVDLIPPANLYHVRVNLLFGNILRDCTNVLQGENGTYCFFDSEGLQVQTSLDFSGRESLNQYVDYENTCAQLGGHMCFADISTSYVISPADVGDIAVTDSFFNFPFCLPPVCSIDGDEEDIIVQKFREYSSNSLITPNCEEGSCDVFLKTYTCETDEPDSSAPAAATLPPKISSAPTQNR